MSPARHFSHSAKPPRRAEATSEDSQGSFRGMASISTPTLWELALNCGSVLAEGVGDTASGKLLAQILLILHDRDESLSPTLLHEIQEQYDVCLVVRGNAVMVDDDAGI